MSQSNSNTKLLVAFMVAMCVIFCLVLYIIFRKPEIITVGTDRSKILRDSITMLTDQISSEKAYTALYMKKADSLLTLDPKIEYKYAQQKKTLPTASVLQLDSIIRANAGLSKGR